MKLTPHEFQSNLDNLISSDTEKLSELLTIAGVRKGDTVQNADFSELDLSEDNFESLKFIDTNFSNSNLSSSNFYRADFRNCLMKKTELSNSKFVRSSLSNLDVTGSYTKVDLDHSRMSKLNLNGCRFISSTFKSATIVSSAIMGAEIVDSNLRSVKFIDSSIVNVKFRDSSMHFAVLEGLHLKNVVFSECILDEANFIGSRFDGTRIDETTSVTNAKFSRDCGLTPIELRNLESRGALLIDDPDISPHPVHLTNQKLAAGGR